MSKSTNKTSRKPSKSNNTAAARAIDFLSNPTNQKILGITAAGLAFGGFFLSQAIRSRSETATETMKGPPPLQKADVDRLYHSAIESLRRKSAGEPTPLPATAKNGPGANDLTPEFVHFYNQIQRSAPPEQHPEDVRCTIAEFLIVYMRFDNLAKLTAPTPVPLSMEQADTIRKWVDFEMDYNSPNVDLTVIASRIDVLYRIALAQKSIPELRKLHQYLCDDFPSIRKSTDTKDDNFFAIYVQHRFLTACIFGLWDEAETFAEPLDGIILPQSRIKLRQKFTQNALRRPHTQCNFNQIILHMKTLADRFPIFLRPTLKFESWPITMLKLKRRISSIGVPLANGSPDWDYFIQPSDASSKRESIVTRMYIYGACIQFMSHERGPNGFLPVTGVWNDTDMYATMEWTFSTGRGGPANGPGTVLKKNLKYELERVCHSSMESCKDVIDVEKDGVADGWIWKGEMTSEIYQVRQFEGAVMFDPIGRQIHDIVLIVKSRD